MHYLLTVILACLFSISVQAAEYREEVTTAFSELRAEERADSLNSVGNNLAGKDSALALEYMGFARELSREIEYKYGIAISLSNTGQLYYYAKDFVLATDYLMKALIALDGDEVHDMTGYLYRRYANAAHRAGQNDEARKAFHESMRVFSSKDDSLGMAYALSSIGLFFLRAAQYDSALVYYPVAEKYYRAFGNMSRTAGMINSTGVAYYRLGSYEKALRYYLESAAIRERIDDKLGLSRVLNNLGKTYQDMGNLSDAGKYYQKGLDIAMEAGHIGVIGYSLFNLGELAEDLGNLDKALEYYKDSERYRREENDIPSLAQSLNAIGAIASKKGLFESALNVLNEAYTMSVEIDDKEGIAVALNNMGIAYADAGDDRKAFDAFERSMRITTQTGNRVLLRETLKQLSTLTEENGNYHYALSYLRRYDALKDSLFNDVAAENINRLKIEYESEQKERENSMFRERNHANEALLMENKKIILLTGFFLLMTVIFAVILFNIYSGKKRANSCLFETNSKISRQRDEIEHKNAALQDALNEINTLSGMLPICANCKKIRDDSGYWDEVEGYISKHSDAKFSHSVCPDCVSKLSPNFADEEQNDVG